MINQKKLRDSYNVHICHFIVLTPTLKYKFYASIYKDDKVESIYNPTITDGEGKIKGYLYFDSYEEGLKIAIKECNKYIKTL